MDPREYERVWQHETRHFWYVGLHALVRTALARHAPGGRVLDAGCGTGGLLASLPGGIGVDVSPLALELARRRGLERLVRAGVEALPLRDASVDAVVSADVLYHRDVSDDVAALRELARVVRPGGHVILNLAAHEWLRGPHDEVVHTARRYTRRRVVALAHRAGLTVVRVTSWNCALFPLAAVARLRSRGGPPASDVHLPPFPLNGLLTGWLRLEARLANTTGLPWGLSIFAVLRKAGASEMLGGVGGLG